MPPVSDGVDAAVKDAPRIALPRFLNERRAKLRAERIPHHKQIAPVEHDILAHGHIKVIVWDEEVARVEQRVHRPNAALGEDAPHTRLPQHPEHLPRRIRARHAAAPAVHAAGQHAPSRDGEEAERRTLTVRCRKVQPVREDLHIRRHRGARKIARERPRAADDGIARCRNLLLCHIKTSVSRDTACRAVPALCLRRESDRSSS